MSAATFSYAQAARGQTASQPSPRQISSPAPSTAGSQGKDDASTGATSVTAPSVASNGPETQNAEQKIASHVGAAPSKQESEDSSIAGTGSSTASVTEHSGKITQENSTKAADALTRSRSEDKGSRSTSRTSRVNDNAEGRRGRKGKKGRGGDKDAQSEQNQEEDAEKAKEAAKPVILTEAPPPAVNPWAKRMEAQKAAVKAKLASVDGPVASNEVKQSPAQEDSGVHSTMSNGVNGPQKKPVEASRPTEQASRRGGPRGSRTGDKDEKNSVSLPPVADPSSWPDPKSAAAREQAPRKPQEKSDSPEKDGQDESAPTRKKTWEKLEIVHSVVFETQLPPLRGTKPRGGARGGREAGSMRGNHPGAAGAASAASQPAASSVSDKAPSPGGSTGPRTTTTRPREGSVPARSTTQPHASHTSKRTSIDGASRDQRKASVPGNTSEQARDVNIDAPFSSKRVSATRDIRTENGQLSSETGQAPGRTLPQERNAVQHRGDYAKDGAHGQQYPAREGRPERGRGGGYRARGGHGGSSSHLGSASYPPNGHYPAPGGFAPRQNPNAHSPPAFSTPFPASFGHPTRGRGNKWAGSGQSAARGNTGATGFSPKAAQVNDYTMAQYPPYMYAPIYDPSVAILKTQVEYYLSVENLCKDYYLRQHMDGQGFAHLSTIAGFKRIKAVTEDLELVRLACSLSDQIEFGVGDDGIERLRIRDKWKHFVLPVHERLEPYRNDGPANWTPYVRPDTQFAAPFPAPIVPQPYPPAAGGAFPAFPEEQMFQPAYVNGAAYIPAVNGGAVNGHLHGLESQLSAGVPEYAPPQSPVTLESMTNFSDSQVENLMMILSYEEKDEAGSPEGAGVAGYVSEKPQASQNALSPSSAEAQSAAGAAASVESSSADQPERGIVWVDRHASASHKEQTDRRPYTEIRKAALDERQNAKSGETPKSMQKLYRFWSQMLLNDFNAKVYQEFRDLALEDASREIPVKVGLKYLLEFYDGLLLHTNTRKPWPQDRAVPEIFTAHFNEAAELDRKLAGKDATTV
ncbi:hypothetical protein C8A03DRAFT_15268 [Achaetomium macrosporum]|uniref:HTH La-type RNA-binding domain-containing protein n=1 Tax=Achaetomium macrosporum TaxID=79813 RepID=A0AAN7CAC2_9PEZI|nr:hypothetical protein C8A03DRAFT_15268 [Achaetomium macrosporum]